MMDETLRRARLGERVIVAAVTFQRARFLMDEMARRVGFEVERRTSDRLFLRGGGEVRFVSAQNPDNLRGLSGAQFLPDAEDSWELAPDLSVPRVRPPPPPPPRTRFERVLDE
jgi:hypothetical protein